jgi:hypothetical protein
MDKKDKISLLEKQVRVYGGGVPASIKSAMEILDLLHGQSRINNMPAVKYGLKLVQDRLENILQDIVKSEEAMAELNVLYDEEDTTS